MTCPCPKHPFGCFGHPNTCRCAGSIEGAPVEIRRNPDQSIDEVIIKGGNIHIEQMSNDGWFMGVDMPNGDYWQFWFGSKNRKSHVEFRHTEFTPAHRGET